jgi:hypothetical protein
MIHRRNTAESLGVYIQIQKTWERNIILKWISRKGYDMDNRG